MLGNLIGKPVRDFSPNTSSLSFPDYVRLWENFGYNGVQYMVPAGGMAGVTAIQATKNPIVLACIMLRAMVFSDVRLVWQRLSGRATADTFGTAALALLEQPWPHATTRDLLARMEFDASRFGNSYWWVDARERKLVWLDPERMDIVTGDQDGPSGAVCGRQLVGYVYKDAAGKVAETFLPDEIVHYRPIPDPGHPFRGLSWLSSLLSDVTADQDLTDFKHSFVRNAATPNLVIKVSANISEDAFVQLKDKIEASHTGPQAGFKTLYLGPGVDVATVGSNFQDMELFATQAFGETRLCVAAGVPASLVGIAEGLKGSTLNTGNYAAARRRFSDGTMRPLWGSVCGALTTAVQVPGGARLWYDDTLVAFLQADLQDAATTRQADAATIGSLVNAGYTPESVVQAVTTNDMTALLHTGLYSVQLQPPGELGEPGGPTDEPTPAPDAAPAATPQPAAA